MALAMGKLAALILGGLLLAQSPLAADDWFFRERIAPIFERHCVVCHHGDQPKGGLSLASAQGLAAGGENGKVIEPGKPNESLLIEMISGDKPAMPQKAKPLAKDQ